MGSVPALVCQPWMDSIRIRAAPSTLSRSAGSHWRARSIKLVMMVFWYLARARPAYGSRALRAAGEHPPREPYVSTTP